MVDEIKHECGIAMIRLKKPYQYYIDKYGTPLYGLNKMYLLMEKQHNRGQDGAGVAVVKLDVPQGKRYISRYKSVEPSPIADIFKRINKKFKKAKKANPDAYLDADWMLKNTAFTGEVMLGHLRYGTHGAVGTEYCHPFLRQSNWRTRSLVMAGNFNMTNVEELFQKLVSLGQHPKDKADTVTVMEKIGHFLDEENQRLFEELKDKYSNQEVSGIIERDMDIQRILQRSCRDFDGGYAMAGMIGSGAAFVARDPNGIRPAYYYEDDEVVVVTSEKPAIKTAFNIEYEKIKEIKPGHALIIDVNGQVSEKEFITPQEKKSCSFERIYFSRGSDPDIYNERKMLGKKVVPQVLKELDHDLENAVFSYIPNTAETSFWGMIEGVEEYLKDHRKKQFRGKNISVEELDKVMSLKPRIEKLVIKDAKLRTFIADDNSRDDLVSHVYDTTYEVINKNVDTVVVIDDSIVRGTTLEKSIIRMLDKLAAKKIIIVSSAPQIRFPDCYGIDMSKMKEFVAFRALLELLKENDKEYLLDVVYDKCNTSLLSDEPSPNYVNELYQEFTYEQLTDKITEIVTPKDLKSKLSIVYQTIEGLHESCPNNKGDWYFTGDYPTKGGNKVVNKAFVNFMEGKEVRAY